MLNRLLPYPVRSAEAYADAPDEASFPGEEQLVATAAPGRRREVLTARRCARAALVALGHAPAAILRGPRREPLWPAGVTGSITHCAGFRAAAVAHTRDVASIGIDAEPHAPLPPRVLGAVSTPADRDLLARLAVTHPGVCWDRLLFSAKESIYKAWYPLTGRWLGFEHARLDIDPDAGTFTGHLAVDGPLTRLHGRHLVDRGLILTAVRVDQPGTAGR
ncbi:4'-phosphopantetheinyl transferase family protein [Actinoplanes teichomyceticus]|uniref:4'-phosphopantetheinyl transferase EntD n=1 Tax=Actinoplanes teichomyceticus TaxID=1867 RepID=A0A561VSR7_ACTTI|nr:4'-phosphopantetheinyl transferase superfamily protein [Actinoplanes teichomyceticus]TWG14665.1 4'-phosphopantetheinyl transferase EntD [Actinoplanes teichomyceticus]